MGTQNLTGNRGAQLAKQDGDQDQGSVSAMGVCTGGTWSAPTLLWRGDVDKAGGHQPDGEGSGSSRPSAAPAMRLVRDVGGSERCGWGDGSPRGGVVRKGSSDKKGDFRKIETLHHVGSSVSQAEQG